MNIKNKLIVILGPTASGKTALAIKLAKFFGGEIISADSRQTYRGMDVGTAKPRRNSELRIKNAELKKEKIQKPIIVNGVPHYLINIKDPDENYTVAEFKDDAIKIIKDIQSRGRTPILCGGTGLYIDAVVKNLDIPRVPPNPEIRKKIEKELKKKGVGFLYKKLIKFDPEAAYLIDPQNGRRIIR
ncbi:MAG: tRNA (adenosine(37)-N6)-dimethylallyltransferase MiaA, partial [bacterium]|nr:tRNA (adenosine(37)-N6)-dimethylallyltransferase MiaA [bacterium]